MSDLVNSGQPALHPAWDLQSSSYFGPLFNVPTDLIAVSQVNPAKCPKWSSRGAMGSAVEAIDSAGLFPKAEPAWTLVTFLLQKE